MANTRKLLYYPEPTLQQKTHEVREFNDDLAQLAQDMRQIMQDNAGMGLAAIQVGDLRRVIIVELPEDKEAKEPEIPFTVLVNPKVTNQGEATDWMKEGCLSVPAVEVDIERAKEITVVAQTLTGEQTRIRAKGLFARILQHEIDHLNNILILDYAKKQEKAGQALKTMVWGSTKFTTEFLNTITSNPLLTLTHLVTEAPKPSGRGKEVTHTIVKTYADTLGIPCLEPEDISDPKFQTYLHAQQPDLILVAAYGKLLPPEVLASPKHGCLNIHPSLLPKYRGTTPIQAAILNGDKKTGVTVINMSPQFDTGALIAQSEIELKGNETYGDLEPLLAEIGGEIINEIMSEFMTGKLGQEPQDDSLASYTKKITPQDRWLNLDDPVELNERKIRAYAPTPGAFVILDGQPLKVLAAHVQNRELVFDMVHPAGRKAMAWNDFKRGYKKALQFEPYQAIIDQNSSHKSF